MLNEVKIGFSHYMRGYRDSLVPTTKAMTEFVGREFKKAFYWGPGHQFDSPEDMLSKVREMDNSGAPGTSAQLPAVVVTMARDMQPPMDWLQPVGDPVYVVLPTDTKQRVFKLRQIEMECPVQVVFFADNEPTARSLALQFGLWCNSKANRRFPVGFKFAGQTLDYRAMLETPDILIDHVPSAQTDLVILTANLNLRISVPLLKAPLDSEPNDGRGTAGDQNDPNGFPVVTGVTIHKTGVHDTYTLEQVLPTDPVTETHVP
jgi:hypothetical protein